MDAISAFFMANIVYVYFFYGLAFFSLGLVVLLESGRASEFRFARALKPLAWFGILHGAHEWFEMFQIFAAHETGRSASTVEELIRITLLLLSFLCLLGFGARLLTDFETSPLVSYLQVAVMAGLWLGAVGVIYWRYQADLAELLVAADVLARYSLAIPGSLLAAWALLRERHDFHRRGMSQYGQGLLWAGLGFLIYGLVGQLFTRPSLVFPSQTINTALFLRTFGVPIQLVRGLTAVGITLTLGSALRAFELESRLRVARANKARIEAQAAALEAQQQRAREVEALNVQLQATARELSAMLELSRILTSTIELDRLLQDALYQVVHSIKRACCAGVFLVQPDGSVRLQQRYKRPGAPEAASPPPTEAIAAHAVATGKATGVGMDGQVHTLNPEQQAGDGLGTALGVPLYSKEQVFGSLVLASLENDAPLGQEELRLLTAFAQQIAAAIDNARLYQIVQEREAQLAQLVRRLVTAQEEERKRIACELHDETGQKLTALAMGLAAVESQLAASGDLDQVTAVVRDLREMSDQAIVELRNIMADLRPAQLDDLGLVPALRWFVKQYQARHPEIQVQLAADRSLDRLPAQYEIVLFRATQEALTNVARHAKATQVRLTLSQDNVCVRLEVRDNGIGFDPAAPPRHAPGSGLGLVGLRERVALVGGRCVVDSAPGRGTRVMIELPLK
ncbi:MAG: GAF domain-containing sensor histidine kinase [Anaerolineae bacterium]|nr:GAF domain-containing sensor histidine kinase [Anaerolineae bacterium]